MDRQREVIYAERREVLEGADLEEQIRTFIDDVVDRLRRPAPPRSSRRSGTSRRCGPRCARSTRSRSTREVLEKEAGGRANLDRDELIEVLKTDAHAAYDRREREVGEEVMRELERRVVLSVLDRKWREHLYEMDYLREGIYLRAYSQRDPLVEYQREGFDMFAAMMDGIKEESVGFLFNLEVQVEEDEEVEEVEEVEVEEPMRQPRARRQPAARGRRTSRPRASTARKQPDRSCPTPPRRGRRGRGDRGRGRQPRRRPVRRRRPQRRLPLRLGQEVQEVPRRSGRAHRPDRAHQRLSEAAAARARRGPGSGELQGGALPRPARSSNRAASARERAP